MIERQGRGGREGGREEGVREGGREEGGRGREEGGRGNRRERERNSEVIES